MLRSSWHSHQETVTSKYGLCFGALADPMYVSHFGQSINSHWIAQVHSFSYPLKITGEEGSKELFVKSKITLKKTK